jgi:glucokinase
VSYPVWAGVDIGGTKTAVLLSANPPELIGRIEFPTLPAQGPGPALDQIRAGLRTLLAGAGLTPADIQAIGVSCGSPMDRRAGLIQAPPNLPTWVDVPITALLEAEFGAPCYLENDANAGAVAEHRFGAGQGARNMVFLTMGTGLGAGLILNGCLFHGSSDSGGEVGHVRLTRSGPVGYHKAGSVEGWASGGGITQIAARAVESAHRRSITTVLDASGPISAKDVAEAAQAGDRVARQILQASGQKLGEALAILIDIVNPERIVIGGIAMRLGDRILNPAREVIRREALAPAAAVCEVVGASLGESIGDVAALSIALGYCAD